MLVKIAGAGISGLCAAIAIAKNSGMSVEVRDKASSIREKIHRGINALRNYSGETDCLKNYQSLGYDLKNFHPIYNQIYYIDSKKKITIESRNKPIFYTITRGDNSSIDKMLLEQAESLNVKLKWNDTFHHPNILATGPKYQHCIGYGKHFNDVEDTNTIVVLQSSKYSPFGYACILPFGKSEATVVLGTFKPNFRISLKHAFQKIVEEIPYFKNYVYKANELYEVKGVGNFGIPETAIVGSSLLTGERAGFLEAFRGYGIHNAIISGYAAGISLVNGKNYDELWKKMLLDQLERGLLRRIAENEQNLGSEQILSELIDKIPEKVTLEFFRRELKKIEKEMLNKINFSALSNSVVEWNKLYSFNQES